MIEAVPGDKPQRARLVRAENPSALTLEGTNTWVLAEIGARRCVLVDPGPEDPEHLNEVMTALDQWELEAALILVTHGHEDHAGGIEALYAQTSAPVRALDRRWCRGTVPVVHDERITIDGLELQILATPGHTEDSMSVLCSVDGALVTGDTVLGSGSSLVAWPDGKLGPYLDSLQELRRLAAAGLALYLLPGHGPQVPNALTAIDTLLAHRSQRLQQVRSVLDEGATSIDEVIERVYGLPGPALQEAVINQVKAQLEYLSSRGESRAASAMAR